MINTTKAINSNFSKITLIVTSVTNGKVILILSIRIEMFKSSTPLLTHPEDCPLKTIKLFQTINFLNLVRNRVVTEPPIARLKNKGI
jgi:hypothetical protein